MVADSSLAYGSASQADAPPLLTKGIGKYPIPLMILGRLAVDRREMGQGLGKALLKDAILRTLQAADIAGLKAIFVQAKDQDAQRFYAKHGLIPSPGAHFISSFRSIPCASNGRRRRPPARKPSHERRSRAGQSR